jgi:hypothetical protein
MVPAALLLTLVGVLSLGFIVMDELAYLRTVKPILRAYYLPHIFGYLLLLSVNLFAASLLLVRKIGLRTIGSKIKHLEKESLAGSALAGQIVSDDGSEE